MNAVNEDRSRFMCLSRAMECEQHMGRLSKLRPPQQQKEARRRRPESYNVARATISRLA